MSAPLHPLHVLIIALLKRAELRRLAAFGDREALIAVFVEQGVEGAMRELREQRPTIH